MQAPKVVVFAVQGGGHCLHIALVKSARMKNLRSPCDSADFWSERAEVQGKFQRVQRGWYKNRAITAGSPESESYLLQKHSETHYWVSCQF